MIWVVLCFAAGVVVGREITQDQRIRKFLGWDENQLD